MELLKRHLVLIPGVAQESSEQYSQLEKKYQSAVKEIEQLKKDSQDDRDYFFQKIEHLTNLVDEQDGKNCCF